MKKLFHTVSIAIISLCLAIGCAGQKLAVKEHSGFLGDYSKLQAGPEGGVDQRYIKEGVNFKQYNKIMLDQVRFYFKNDAADKGIDAAEMKELADIYVGRGLPRPLAEEVAWHMTKGDGESDATLSPTSPLI